jgi:predicted lipoprotein with Yx(FWY)xxD motif
MRIHIGARAIAAAMAATVVLAAACGGSSSSGGSGNANAGSLGSGPIQTAQNSSLGTSVLVNQAGMTLYSLSAEKNGRFICTNSACLKLWHPVIAPSAGLQSDSVSSLGTVQRPGGNIMQVTYRGLPLYTFTGDHKPGSAAGNGFKDVGTWLAATTSNATATTPASTSSGGGGYGY